MRTQVDAPATLSEKVFAWMGGGLFVGALADCAYTYAVRWAVPVAGDGLVSVGADAALLTVFALHHSLLARESAKALIERIVPKRLLRASYVWTASALLLMVLRLWRPVGATAYEASGAAAAALGLVQIAGALLIARSVAAIDPLELAGIRAGSGRDGLQVSGPYRIVRHPLYLGWILVVFGAARMTGDRLSFAVMTTAYVLAAVPWEERALRSVFGAEYERYQETVRWRVLPFIY